LSKGKGYCSNGSRIEFERPKPAKVTNDQSPFEKSKEKLGPTKLVGGKVVTAKGKPGGGKQVTLGAMMAKKAASAVSQVEAFACCARLTPEAAKEDGSQACRSDHQI
jgi:hypothetical protein